MLRKAVLVAVTVCLWGHMAMAQIRESNVDAPPPTSSSTWSDAGYGTLAAVVNIVYMPSKIVYAAVGVVTGGFAYVLTGGDDDAAMAVWSPSVGGTYVVTPAMIRGEEPVLFSGPSHYR